MPEKIKVLQYIDNLRSGGKERQLVELLKGLVVRQDIECELATMSREVHYSYIEDLGIRTHFLLRKSKKDFSIFFKLHRLCRQLEPDIIHSWSSMCSVYSVPVSKLLGIKFINGFPRGAPSKLRICDAEWLRIRVGLTFPFSDYIVANSRAGLKAYNVPANKAHFIHNGFDFKRLVNGRRRSTVKTEFGIITDKTVGMVASFSDNKDYRTFLAAAQRILAQRKDVTFIAVGDGNNLDNCKKSIAPQFRKYIKFLGKQRYIESIVNIFTIGVLTTYTEGISNSIMEYMALGKPVVTTDCGGNRELVIDGETGFLVRQGAVEDLAGKLMQLLDDKELAARLGESGRQRISQEFSIDKMTDEFLSLYQNVMERKIRKH